MIVLVEHIAAGTKQLDKLVDIVCQLLIFDIDKGANNIKYLLGFHRVIKGGDLVFDFGREGCRRGNVTRALAADIFGHIHIKEIDIDTQKAGKIVKPATGNAVLGFFVFLDLLERQAEASGKLLLREFENLAAQANAVADMNVNLVGLAVGFFAAGSETRSGCVVGFLLHGFAFG